jgi:Family of unknown function (DUF6152)
MSRILNAKSGFMFAVALLGSMFANAHHSYAAFDSQKEVTVKGTVKEFKFENPHVSIVMTVTDPKDRKPTDWFIEANSVRGLLLNGWRKSSLKAGDTVTITGHPLRDGRPGASLMSAQLADGSTLKSASKNY